MSTSTTDTTKMFFDNVIDAQKAMFNTMKDTTEKLTDNLKTANPLETNKEYFQKWYDQQMEFFNNAGQNGTAANLGEYQAQFTKWMNTQMDLFKTFVENNQKNQWNMNSYNPFQNNQNPWTGQWNQWVNSMNEAWGKMGFNANHTEAFKGMMNNADMFGKFYELWAPVMKSMGEGSFKAENFANLFNTETYKNMMNQWFSMAPEGVRSMVNELNRLFTQYTGQTMDLGSNTWNQWKSQWNNMNSTTGYNTVLEQYNTWFGQMQQAASPLMKMMTPGDQKNQLEAAARIQNELVTFSVKNAHMSHLVYNTGMQAFETLAKTWAERVKNGEKADNLMAAYQEFLNLNDAAFVALFESDEYSKLQSELASAGMRLKKDLDLQIEKMLGNLPLINRTEMDELYKTVYELKKRVRTLEKELEGKADEPVAKAPVSTAKTNRKK